MKNWGSLCIASTFYEWIPALFLQCWTNTIIEAMRDGDRLAWPSAFAHTHTARNVVARIFYESTECESLFFVDSDMHWQPSDVDRLRDNADNFGYDIISALATTKRWPPRPIVPRQMETDEFTREIWGGSRYKDFLDFELGEVVPTDGCGMAFTLIRRKVFEAMLHEAGPEYTDWFQMPKRTMEDAFFCDRAMELGFKCAVDTSVRVGHLGYNPMGWWSYELWQKVKALEDKDDQT